MDRMGIETSDLATKDDFEDVLRVVGQFGAHDPEDTILATAQAVAQRDLAHDPYRSPKENSELIPATYSLRWITEGRVVEAEEDLSPLGFTVTAGVDKKAKTATGAPGRQCVMAVSEIGTEREWGLYVIDTTSPVVPVALAIAVPHTTSDKDCHRIAMELWWRVPRSAILMSTVHRHTAWIDGENPEADEAYNGRSLFHHAWRDVFGPTGAAQVQIHGFTVAQHPKLEGVGAVVSAGSTKRSTPLAKRVISKLTAIGLTCRGGWQDPGRELAATGNLQGQVARGEGWPWVHVELEAAYRDPGTTWPAKIAQALAKALT